MAQRFGFVLLMATAAGMLILGNTHGEIIRQMRVMAMEAVAPLLEVMSTPVLSARRAFTELEFFWNTNLENRVLRQQVERLTKWQMIARNLEKENSNLRALLNPAYDPAPIFISARVISDGGGLFVQSALLNAGRHEGGERGQAATTGLGLVGRVVEVGQKSSRLLLITDLNSRVPVLLEHSRHRAVLAGDNSTQPRLTFLPANAEVNPGDRVITSGHAGVFPAGLSVGIISSVSEDKARVQPFVDWGRLEYVTILRYRALPADDITRMGFENAIEVVR